MILYPSLPANTISVTLLQATFKKVTQTWYGSSGESAAVILGAQSAKGTTNCRKAKGADRVVWHTSATTENECRRSPAACVVACKRRQIKSTASQYCCLPQAHHSLPPANEGWMSQATEDRRMGCGSRRRGNKFAASQLLFAANPAFPKSSDAMASLPHISMSSTTSTETRAA